MKEFIYPLDEWLKAGLRPSSHYPVNAPGASNLFNFVVREHGLEPFTAPTGITTGLTFSWPFQQVFIGYKYRILADSTNIYQLNSSWTKTLKVTASSAGYAWDFVDFGDHFVKIFY